MSKRKIFDEMMEGVRAMKSHRDGKITLPLTTLKRHGCPRWIRS